MFSSAALCFPNKSSSRMQNRPFIFKILYLGRGGANLFGFDPVRDKSKRRTLLALTLPPSNARPLIILPFPFNFFFLITFPIEKKKKKKLVINNFGFIRIGVTRMMAFAAGKRRKFEFLNTRKYSFARSLDVRANYEEQHRIAAATGAALHRLSSRSFCLPSKR